MKKVCVVITARPSYSRIRSALLALKKKPDIQLSIIVAASASLDLYGKVINTIKADGFDIDSVVYNLVAGENTISSAKTTGMGIIELSTAFETLKPDMVVTIADRFETLATAVAASYMNIPLIHIQGGEVTGNIDEKVRHAITKLADIHIVSTEKAKERVMKMGEREDRIFVTGCPSIDIAREVKEHYDELKFDPIKKYNGVGRYLEKRDPYIVVQLHPVTTELDSAKKQTDCVLEWAAKIGCQVYWFWPNVDAGSDAVTKEIRIHRELNPADNIYYFTGMGPEDFLVLLMGARCIVGNSSVAIRECSYLGVPAINIGNRQIGRERGGNVIDCEFNIEAISSAYNKITNSPRCCSDDLYGDGYAGERIADVIEGLNGISVSKILTY